MKTTISIFAAGLLFINSFSITAQDTENEEKPSKANNTEFNIGVSDLFAKSTWLPIYYDYTENYPDSYLNPKMTSLIAGFKFHDPKGAFRLSTGFHYSRQNQDDPKSSYDKNASRNFSMDLNVGYEWHSRFQKVTIFYGFDVLTGYNDGMSNYENFPDKSESKMKVFKYGAAPLVGVNYFLTSNLSIGTEFKINFTGYSGKSTSTYQYGAPPNMTYGDSETKLKGFDTYFGPLGYLSVNIYF
jgi:hypothetical protein